MKNDTVLILVKVNVGPFGSKMALHTQMEITSDMTEAEVAGEIDQHVLSIRSTLRDHFGLPSEKGIAELERELKEANERIRQLETYKGT